MSSKKAKSAAPKSDVQDEEHGTKALRHLDETFEEWRHPGTASGTAYLGSLMLSFGGLLLGAGTYALAAIPAGPFHDRATWMLLGGLALEAGFVFFGGKEAPVVRVGELGVAREEDGRLARLAWCDVTRVALVDETLQLETKTAPWSFVVAEHPAAVARILREASKRISKRVALDAEDVARLGKVGGGERVEAEAPQVTKERCRASSEALTFEKDVRMCGRCGALYHRNGVPRRCVECGRKLKANAGA